MDIVEQLRDDPIWGAGPGVAAEAADEIERLRQQVAELVEVLHEGVRSLTDDQPAIVDVVWCATQPCETLHDYFVAAIAKATGGE